jgi:simple sugar transport system ATP-binding protein
VRLAGVDMTGQPYARYLGKGVAYLPVGRLEEGLIPGLDLCEHVALAERDCGGFFINWPAARQRTVACIQDFNIKGRPETRVEALSGGNQQRALLALLSPSLRLLLLEHPTRGLDVESTLWVWGRLLERRHQGTAILFTSADLDEILEHSDRILVFSGGQVTRALRASETTVAQLGEYIGGVSESKISS